MDEARTEGGESMMKEAREYTKAILDGLKNWTEWVENGETILSEKGWLTFHILINSESNKLRKLDAQDVLDNLLEHDDGIDMRIKRLERYMGIKWENGKFLVGIPQYIVETEKKTPNLSDEVLNGQINTYRQIIKEKALDLIRVIRECEKFIPKKHPIIIKALADPLLLSFFYDNKKVLEEYINFCLIDTNKAMKAYRAKELVNQGKIKDSCKLKPLHDALEKIGIDVGSYPNWQQSINKF